MKKNPSYSHRLFIIFGSIFLLNMIPLLAQNSTISGYVQDIQTNEKLINASVYDLYSKKGTITNNYGYYSLSLPTNKPIKLIASYVGYLSDTLAVNLARNEKYDFSLLIENRLNEVVINARKEKPIEQRNDMGVISIPIKKAQVLPAIGGESDIIKALQLMPGVQSGNEASSYLFVRGGSPDQNLMLLDDVPLYKVSHMLGFISTFNTDALKNVKLIKGGFPASFGNRLSSVVDVRMREGNAREFHGSGMIGMLASKISVEGPIIKGKSSYIISYRRMLYDLLASAIGSLSKNKDYFRYYFYDFNAKINYQFSEKNHVFFSLYMGNDRYTDIDEEKNTNIKDKQKNQLNWGNKLFAFRWNHLFSQKIFSNLTLSYTKYGLSNDLIHKVSLHDETQSYEHLLYNTNINDATAKIDFDYYLHPNYKLKFGANATKHSFNPGLESFTIVENNTTSIDTLFKNNKVTSLEMDAYIENHIDFGKYLSTNIGVRYVRYHVNKKNYKSIEPRFLINLKILENTSIKTSYAEMQQNVHLLTSDGVGLPIDIWMPATKKVVPQKSKQLSFGITNTTKNNNYEISIESYYKKMNNLITYKEGATHYNTANNWEEKIEKNGLGISYGIEFLFQKKYGQTTGWFAYTLSKTNRQFENINFGKSYPYRYDKRHDISIVLQQKINKNVNFSATWMYGTGNSISLPEGKYQILYTPNQYNGHYGSIDGENGENGFAHNYADIRFYNGKNGFKMRDFHKLVFSFLNNISIIILLYLPFSISK